MSAIGMNLAGVSYWSTQVPFIDRFKTSGWYQVTADGWRDLPADAPVDEHGYPTSMPDGIISYEALFAVDPEDAGTSRIYVVTWKGEATVAITSDAVIAQSAHRIVFRHTGETSWADLGITAIDGANPIHDIHVVRRDQLGPYRAGELFNPAFLEKQADWETLRFMDWGNTNGSTLTSWSERTTPDSASWAANSSTSSVPIEIMVALANQTRDDLWLNIPAQADDDYVANTLRYVRDHLADGLKVKVEYSNEMWNWGFEQSRYAAAMGDQLWGRDRNHDGVIDPSDPREHVGDGWVRFYGYRSAQVAAIAHEVFGDESASRLVDVLATQTGWAGLEQSIFKGAIKAGVGLPRDLFDSYAVTTYFGGDFDGVGDDPATIADRATVLGWARAGQAGMDAAFRQLEHGGLLNGDGSLAALDPLLDYQAGVAAKRHLSLVAYEGGVHFTASAYDRAVQGEIIDFFDRLVADPRMGDLYTVMVDRFTAAGGTELNAFTDVGQGSVWGQFGALDSIYDDGSARWDALLAAQHAHTAAFGWGGPAGAQSWGEMMALV